MLDVSVWGTDKALHKFESRMPTSQGLGGEILAAGQVLDRGGGGGWGGLKRDRAWKMRELFFLSADEFLFADVSTRSINKSASSKGSLCLCVGRMVCLYAYPYCCLLQRDEADTDSVADKNLKVKGLKKKKKSA